MPALVMTSRHFFTSSRMREPSVSGEPGSGSTPCLAKAARTSGYRGDIRQGVIAHRAGHRQSAQLARADMRQRWRDRAELHLDAAFEQIERGLGCAAIRHVGQLDLCHFLEQRAREVRQRRRPGGRVVQSTRPGFCERDQVPHGLRGHGC